MKLYDAIERNEVDLYWHGKISTTWYLLRKKQFVGQYNISLVVSIGKDFCVYSFLPWFSKCVLISDCGCTVYCVRRWGYIDEQGKVPSSWSYNLPSWDKLSKKISKHKHSPADNSKSFGESKQGRNTAEEVDFTHWPNREGFSEAVTSQLIPEHGNVKLRKEAERLSPTLLAGIAVGRLVEVSGRMWQRMGKRRHLHCNLHIIHVHVHIMLVAEESMNSMCNCKRQKIKVIHISGKHLKNAEMNKRYKENAT